VKGHIIKKCPDVDVFFGDLQRPQLIVTPEGKGVLVEMEGGICEDWETEEYKKWLCESTYICWHADYMSTQRLE
jgi:hypothetical protein